MAQTVREWARDANIPLRSFAVCSDSQVGKRRRRNDDLIDMDALDLAFPATTDATRLAAVAAPPAPDALTVVFATYQSSPVIEEAQKVHGVPAFDLAICDEAHRTAGALIEGEDPSHFVRIHQRRAHPLRSAALHDRDTKGLCRQRTDPSWRTGGGPLLNGG